MLALVGGPVAETSPQDISGETYLTHPAGAAGRARLHSIAQLRRFAGRHSDWLGPKRRHRDGRAGCVKSACQPFIGQDDDGWRPATLTEGGYARRGCQGRAVRWQDQFSQSSSSISQLHGRVKG